MNLFKIMKFTLKNLAAVVFIISAVASCYAQDCSTPQANLPKECFPADGKVSSYFDETSNIRAASLLLYLAGASSDVSHGLNIRISRDVLIMNIAYRAPRNIIPSSIYLRLTSYSNEPSKYEGNHKLTIYLDDKLLLSENLRETSSIIIAEIFSFDMKYSDFLEFTKAKKVTMQLGNTKIELKAEQIEALNKLNETTKGLKSQLPQPPPI